MSEICYLNADTALQGILRKLLRDDTPIVGSRQGERTRERTQQTFTILRPWEREILNPARKASIVAQIAETMWVLSGRSDVGWLSRYLPRAADFSDDGHTWRGAYGPRIRTWGSHRSSHDQPERYFDQLRYVVELLRREPESRRAIIVLYDPPFDALGDKDIPCNNWLAFTLRDGRLDLSVSIRSNDVIWGWSGINQFEWSVLLEIVARLVGAEMGQITYTVASQHIYEKHWGRAEEIVKETVFLHETTHPSARFGEGLDHLTVDGLDKLIDEWFSIEEAICTRQSVGLNLWGPRIAQFPEPMMREWLYLIAAYWTQDVWGSRGDSRVRKAFANEMARRKVVKLAKAHHPRAVEAHQADVREFTREAMELHARKANAYGDSWRRRGETFGILPNIARKVDRLGTTSDDETAADTALDLLIYAVKYEAWLGLSAIARTEWTVAGEISAVDRRLRTLADEGLYGSDIVLDGDIEAREENLTDTYNRIEGEMAEHSLEDQEDREERVKALVRLAAPYAFALWRAARDAEGRQVAAERAAAWKPGT